MRSRNLLVCDLLDEVEELGVVRAVSKEVLGEVAQKECLLFFLGAKACGLVIGGERYVPVAAKAV